MPNRIPARPRMTSIHHRSPNGSSMPQRRCMRWASSPRAQTLRALRAARDARRRHDACFSPGRGGPMHRGHAFGLGVIVTSAVVGLLVLFEPSHRIAHESKLPVADRLPEVARAALKTQMHTHARGMLELVSTVTVLDYDGARASV